MSDLTHSDVALDTESESDHSKLVRKLFRENVNLYRLDGRRHGRRGGDARELGRLLDAGRRAAARTAVLGQVVEGLAQVLLREAVAARQVHDQEDEVRQLSNDEDPAEGEGRVRKAVCQSDCLGNNDNATKAGRKASMFERPASTCTSQWDSPARRATPVAEPVGVCGHGADGPNAKDEEEEADSNLDDDGRGPGRGADEEEDTEAGR